eukprot:2659-Eustigmatos_ZCMA.PRE.1
MPIDPETLYLQLRRLVASMPDLRNEPLSPALNLWLGRAAVLVEEIDRGDAMSLKFAADSLGDERLIGRVHRANTIVSVVHRALASAEMHAP